MEDFEPDTVCEFATGEVGDESFIDLVIVDGSTFELEITNYNVEDYSADKKKAGYICEKDGKSSITYIIRYLIIIITFKIFGDALMTII